MEPVNISAVFYRTETAYCIAGLTAGGLLRPVVCLVPRSTSIDLSESWQMDWAPILSSPQERERATMRALWCGFLDLPRRFLSNIPISNYCLCCVCPSTNRIYFTFSMVIGYTIWSVNQRCVLLA